MCLYALWYRKPIYRRSECVCAYSEIQGFACSKANSNFQALTLFEYLHAIRVSVFFQVCLSLSLFLHLPPPPPPLPSLPSPRKNWNWKRDVLSLDRQYPLLVWVNCVSHRHTHISMSSLLHLYPCLGLWVIAFANVFMPFIFACCFRVQYARDKSEREGVRASGCSAPCRNVNMLALASFIAGSRLLNVCVPWLSKKRKKPPKSHISASVVKKTGRAAHGLCERISGNKPI